MRIWDIHPGYLARQQLLGEHSELHGLYNVLSEKKQGYATHPETLRWSGRLSALCLRHELLAEEMLLRGYRHHSPLSEARQPATWPDTYLDRPGRQFELLADKYAADGRSGRIPLPKNAQQLWAQHKYSVMAHDPALYSRLGPELSGGALRNDMAALSLLLVEALRRTATRGRTFNALQHMWGHLNDGAEMVAESPAALLADIQRLAGTKQEMYLLHSTALSELAVWV